LIAHACLRLGIQNLGPLITQLQHD
jgi:hypothetical protein